MNVGERIKFFRQKQNITVNKLANLAGISQSYLRDLELGKKQPTVEYLSYICDALGITLERFFVDEDKETELNRVISELSNEQKTVLTEFLKTMVKKGDF
ncbi:MAG: helix-turn-helix domain-containing protein [Clostridia bacterium]|nr:helix-turn-helix domain-containing protein [Clostridia bacterium]